MGYIHDSSMKYFVPPSLAGGYGGTWAHSNDGTFWTLTREALGGSFDLAIPVAVPHQNSNENRGSRIASVDVYFKISDQNLTSLAVEFNLQTLPTTGEFDSPSNPTFTYDTDHDAAGERVTQGSHVMTLTLTTATWVQGTQCLRADLIAVAPAATLFEFFGASLITLSRISSDV